MSKESSLRASFLDGVYASIMFGLTVNYVTPFAILLGSDAFQVGLLNSLPVLFGSIVQLFSDDVVKKFKDRVKTITLFVYLQAITWLLVCSVYFVQRELRFLVYILLICINNIFGSVAMPAWASLMSDTVDATRYGEYFAWRGKVLGFITFVVSFIAGFFLYFIPNKFLGFLILFLVAGVMRIFSGFYLGKMEEVHITHSPEREFTYLQFIKRFPVSNFVKFVFFVSLINFGTFLASPFFAVYLLDVLKVNYSTYTIITSATTISGLITLPLWGKFTDRYGNMRVIKVVAKLLPILPVLWLFSANPVYLTLINVLAGYLWAGFNLAVLNFIFDATSQDVRTRCLGYFSFTNGVFIFLGSILGGWLALSLPEIWNSRLLTLFLLSGVVRFLVSLFFVGSLNEVKKVHYIDERKLFYKVFGLTDIVNLGNELVYRYLNKKSG